jgi:hypothetical protein
LITDPNATGAEAMTDGQMVMNQLQGSVIAGLPSDKQYGL